MPNCNVSSRQTRATTGGCYSCQGSAPNSQNEASIRSRAIAAWNRCITQSTRFETCLFLSTCSLAPFCRSSCLWFMNVSFSCLFLYFIEDALMRALNKYLYLSLWFIIMAVFMQVLCHNSVNFDQFELTWVRIDSTWNCIHVFITLTIWHRYIPFFIVDFEGKS